MTNENSLRNITLLQGDCLEQMKSMPDNSVDSVVTDPPYGISFMGKKWDYDVPSVEIWAECLRVLKPGGYLLAFSGTRTYHRMACAIDDAGFEVRDMIEWVYGSGFPKSLNLGKVVDKRGGKSVSWFGKWLRDWREKENIPQRDVSKLFPSKTGGLTGCVANWELGLNMPTNEQFNLICKTFNLPFESLEEAERQVIGTTITNKTVYQNIGGTNISGEIDITKGTSDWEGWGTSLKPAHEPICMARKPLGEKTVAENCLKWGTGGINIDGCRVEWDEKSLQNDTKRRLTPRTDITGAEFHASCGGDNTGKYIGDVQSPNGRFPANLIHDGSEEVLAGFPQSKGQQGDVRGTEPSRTGDANCYGVFDRVASSKRGDSGSAARFFYCAKASKKDRDDGLDAQPDKILAASNQAQAQLKRGVMHEGDSGMNTAKVRKNNHPTVKPTDLMRYLCRLVTPPKGKVLDPFMGSGSTGKAAVLEGFGFTGIEIEEESFDTAGLRIASAVEKTKIVQMELL